MLGNGLFSTYNPPAVWADDSYLTFDGINDFCQATFTSTVDTNAIMVRDNFTLALWVEGNQNINGDVVIWEMRESPSPSHTAYMQLWYDYSAAKLYFTRTDINGANEQRAEFDLGNDDIQTRRHMIAVTCITTPGDVPGVSQIFVNGSAGSAKIGGAVGEWSGVATKLYYGAQSGTSLYFTGHINNIAIWRGVKDGASIRDIYNEGEPKNEINSGKLMFYHAVNEKDFLVSGSDILQNVSLNEYDIPRSVLLSGATVTHSP